MSLLEAKGVELSFSGVKALQGVDLVVPEGGLTAVIGPNGAGKSSLFNCISGVYKPQSGTITLDGESLLGRTPHAIAASGVARMFQNLALFEHLTVLENLLLGRHPRYRSKWWQDVFFTRGARREEIRHRAKAEEIIDFLGLARYRLMPAGILPYGVQKRVELGRALCTEPRILLLDEPAAGLNQEETEDLAAHLLDVRRELGITLVLIEHELRFVLDLADRVTVLDFGQVIAEGAPDEIRNHPAVIEAYAGGAA